MSALLQSSPRLPRTLLSLAACLILPGSPAHASDQPHWLRVSSDHFVVLTDAGQKKGHEIAARFEQMRAVFADLLVRNKVRMAQPIEIIAVASPAEYSQLAPSATAAAPGIFLRGQERVFVVLNASVPDCWRAIEYPFAHYLLDYNYPPTQPWFDEGFAEYFSSAYFTPQKTEFDRDAELPNQPSKVTTREAASKSLSEILTSPAAWMPLTDLLETKRKVSASQEAQLGPLFYAESWTLVRYLVDNGKLSDTGTYFGLVESQNVPASQAIQQAFGMSPLQLEAAVKDYFRSLKSAAANPARGERSIPGSPSIRAIPLPFGLDDVGSSAADVPLAEAQALVDEMELRIPERRERAVEDLQKLASGVKTETLVAHRALAWVAAQKGDLDMAFKELNSAMQMNPNDPWTRFGLALAAYHSGEKGARIQGLANTMESLHIVIGMYPEFAEAYNILGWADLTGGGANAAVEAMRMAVQLSPRDESYQLRLAEAYVAAKNWKAGNAILDRLKSSPDPEIAAAAQKELYDLPFLEKFGILPAEHTPPKPQAIAHEEAPKEKEKAEDHSDDSSEDANSSPPPKPAAPQIDKRPVKFLKGRLVLVDCSQAPAAVLTISEGRKTLKLATADYKSLVVLGADGFSCDWKEKQVAVNYRPGGKLDGDLVSVEIQ